MFERDAFDVFEDYMFSLAMMQREARREENARALLRDFSDDASRALSERERFAD